MPEDTPHENLCPRCSKPLPAGSPRGLCPACLLACGLETNTVGYTDDGQARARWTPPSVEQLALLFPELDILELIGRGGMGAVYKAREKQLDRLVALKILPPEIGREEAFAQRFAREAQAMAKLSHPNIVTIYSFGSTSLTTGGRRGSGEPAAGGDLYFFIMEYVDGLSLRQLLEAGTACGERSRTIRPKEALAIVPQICDALQYAHDRGIVHRDIKPENILLDRTGKVKIADFGLAKLVGFAPSPSKGEGRGEGEAGATATGIEAGSKGAPGVTQAGEKVMGTPQYMAPEQIERPREVDHRADIYSLGVVFYQMLTGELPRGKFEPPSRKVLIDVRLDEVVLRALEREPARRYQQVSEVRTQVETIVASPAGQDVQASKQAISFPPGGKARFSRLAIVGAAWAPFAPIALFLIFYRRAVVAGSVLPGPTMFQILMTILLGGLGLTAPFGTTICGVVSISRIRHSAGRIYGLGLAVFDALLFPLLALDGIIAYCLVALARLIHFSAIESNNMMIGIVAAIIVSAVTDSLIFLWAWRAAKRPVITGQPTQPNSSPRLAALSPEAAVQIDRSRRTVKAPAIGMIVAAGINLAAVLVLGTLGYIVAAFGQKHYSMVFLLGIAALCIGGFMLWAAIRMLKLRGFAGAIAASIMAITAVPAVLASISLWGDLDPKSNLLLLLPEFAVGLPMGIWALVVLSRRKLSEVRTQAEMIVGAAGLEFGESRRGVRYRGRVPIVGALGGRRVINWPGAVLATLLAGALALAGAFLFDLILYRLADVSLIGWQFAAIAIGGAVIVVGSGILRAYKLPIEQLTALDSSSPRPPPPSPVTAERVNRARQAVKAPAIGMIVAAGINLAVLLAIVAVAVLRMGSHKYASPAPYVSNAFQGPAAEEHGAVPTESGYTVEGLGPGTGHAEPGYVVEGLAGSRIDRLDPRTTQPAVQAGSSSGWMNTPRSGMTRFAFILVLPLLLGFSLNGMVFWGAMRMMQLRSRGLAITAAILALIAAPGNIIGLPMGIWSLVVLSRREVGEAFAATGAASVPRKFHPLRWVVAVCVLALIGAIIWASRGPSKAAPSGAGLSRPTDPKAAELWDAIQLAGVLPDGGDDILDVEGRSVGKGFALGPWSWNPDSQARTLVFDIPQSPELVWTVFPEVQVTETGRPLGGGMTGWTDFQGKRRRILALTINRAYQKHGWFRDRSIPVDRIDVTVKYYLPKRGEAVCTFIGPFEAGKAIKCQEGLDCTLTPMGSMWSDGRGTKFHVSATNIPVGDEAYRRVLAHDFQGRQHLLGNGGGGSGGSDNLSSAERDYVIEGLSLARIAAITIGEEPQQKTFRNILVTYPDRPARDRPEYLDEMAEALGLTQLSREQLQDYRFKDAEDALKVIDIVRGPHIDLAWQAIERTDFAALPADTQDKVRRTAKTWADNGYFQGIGMGLTGQWPGFVAPALVVLGQDTRFRWEVAQSLQAYRQFTPQELEQIAAVLEERDDPRGMDSLLRCLRTNARQPGGQEALLRVARSDKVWLWWPALGYLTGRGLTLGQLDRDLQVKYLAKTNPELGLDAALAAEARTLLAALPTAKLATMSTGTLSEVMRSVAKNLPRAEAQATFLDLLEDMVAHWGDYQFEAYGPSTWWAIDRAVRYLNKWNGLDLGGIGADVTQETERSHSIDWPALAREALEHFGRKQATSPAARAMTSVSVETEPRTFTLVDALGKPIPEATLDLHLAAWPSGSLLRPRRIEGEPAVCLRTDPMGSFQVAWPSRNGKPQNYYYTGQASHSDYGIAPVVVRASDQVVKALLAQKGSQQHQRALKGQVVNEASQPVAGALVESSRALTPGVNGQGSAITDSTGRFVMCFVRYSDKDKAKPLPSDAQYDVVARAPAGMDLFPIQMRVQTPARLVLRTPTLKPRRLRFEVGDEQYAQGDDLDCIRLTWMPPDPGASGICLEASYISDKPVRLIPGQYRARYHDGHGRLFDYVPVEIDASSPEVVAFRRPPAVTYHGQVVDGITGEPVAGAFVFTYGGGRGNANLAMLFERDWRNLEAMPEKPSLDDPGVKALDRHHVVESIVRSDAEGRYEITRGREQQATSLMAFAKDRLPMETRLSKLGAGEGRVEVPAIPLFPAAYVQLRPEVPVGARVSVYPQWEYQAEGQPEWFRRCQAAMKRAGFPAWLDTSGPVRIFVPAQINFKLRFQASSHSSVTPQANEQVMKLSPGETKDLGVLNFVPSGSPVPGTQPAAGFGPANERAINDLDEGRGDEGLVLATGQVVSLPPDFGRMSNQQCSRWIEDRGIDLFVEYAKNRWGLMSCGLQLSTLNAPFESVSPEAVQAALAAGAELDVLYSDGFKFYLLQENAKPPLMFAFKTREGGLGVLEIVGFADDPKGTRIRYKLLQPAAAAQSSSATSAPVTQPCTQPIR